MFSLPPLTLSTLKTSAQNFAGILQKEQIAELFGANDGKTVGTYVEQLFKRHLTDLYSFELAMLLSVLICRD